MQKKTPPIPIKEDLSKGGRPRIGSQPIGQNPRVQFVISERDRARLRLLSERTKTTEAEIIRRLLVAHLDEQLGQDL